MTREDIKKLAEEQFPDTPPKERTVEVDFDIRNIFKEEYEHLVSKIKTEENLPNLKLQSVNEIQILISDIGIIKWHINLKKT